VALDEYKRKRNFLQTPEPGPQLEQYTGHRFVVQKHRASHLHYDFRLEMEGVLKSWAVPKGPSLDPADKRLAMMVEDHPVSYIHFEGTIPPDNYGAGTVMVWDTGTWEPEGNASEMLKKGDLKFRLNGEKLKGSFVLAHIKARRPGSKGNEWLLIKHRDSDAVAGYDIDKYDYSVLTHRTLDQIAGDEVSAEWQSDRPAATRRGKDWLAGAIAKHDELKHKTAEGAEGTPGRKAKNKKQGSAAATARSPEPKNRSHPPLKGKGAAPPEVMSAPPARSASSAVDLSQLNGARKAPMPDAIHPMLATLVDAPFNAADWLYEIKWDGYRALAFITGNRVRLVSRNQNEMTAQYPELRDLAGHVRARQAIIDGEIVALDDEGRPSFSLMQQRTGIGTQGRRIGRSDNSIPIVYYAFDLLYLDGYDVRRVDLEQRKEVLSQIVVGNAVVRYSEHFPDGNALYEAAKQRGLEGIVAKRRRSCYVEKRSREWLKIKITQRQECVIGGYTDPKGSREHFGSIVLGLYDSYGRLIHVGQAGSGFTQATHEDMWQRLKRLETDNSPFHGKVETSRKNHWVRPELVAEIKFTGWTHETAEGGVKMRAPVYEGLRFDKAPRECVVERAKSARAEIMAAERDEAA
jgi:bifunctional non-homologous end joining protein LigD